MPSSSLVEVEVGDEVQVGAEVDFEKKISVGAGGWLAGARKQY